MAQMTIKCPHCNAELQVQKEWISMEIECPVCKNSFTIPTPVPTQPVSTSVNSTISTKTFHFVCPSCNGEAELPESLCGTKYECQFCFDKHIAYSAISSQKNTPQPVIEEKFIFICPECDTVAELPESLKDKEYECSCCCETSIAREAVERDCPYCGEKIKIKAKVCKHCKKNVQPIAPAPTGNRQFSTSPAVKSKHSNVANSPNTFLQPFYGQNNIDQHMITPEIAKDKTWIGLVLWQLLWPGAGQIYLGQKNKGITYAALVLPLMIVSGLFSFVPGIGFLLSRVVFLSSCGIIIAESFAALAMLQMGGSVIRDKWIPRAQQRHITASMPSDLKSKWIKALAIVIFALLLGLTGPGIFLLIVLLCSL